MAEKRASVAQGFKAGLLSLRAQGLEPSAEAKEMALQVVEGNMALDEMSDALVAKHRRTQTRER